VTVVKKVIDFMGNLAGHVLHGVGSVFGSIGHIFGLANGGTLSSSGMVMVGEQGPELLNLPRGATVTPLVGNGLAMLKAQLGDGGSGSGPINLTTNVVLDSKVVASAVARVRRNNNNRK
jgi:hypothetical protein